MGRERLRHSIDKLLDKVLPLDSDDYIHRIPKISDIPGDTSLFMARHEIESALIDSGLQRGQRAAVTNALTRFPKSTIFTVGDFRNMSDDERYALLSESDAIGERRLQILDALFK